MKESTIIIWLVVVFALVTIVNFYMGCYNMHNFNEHVAEHQEIIKTIPPRVVQIDINYKYPSDTSLIQVERKSKVQQ